MSVIDTIFQDASVVAIIVALLFTLGLSLFFVLIIFIHILDFLLARRLDHIVFNNKYFSLGEISMLSLWPFSLFKSSYYTFLITFPNFARKKRFKGLQSDLRIETPLKVASKIYMYLYLLFVVVGVSWFISMFVSVYY